MKKTLLMFVIFLSLFVFNFAFADEILIPSNTDLGVSLLGGIATSPSEPDLPLKPQETLIIRNGDSVLWSGKVDLPDSSTIQIDGHDVNARSVLGLLYFADKDNDNFSLSDLSYSDSFKTFYLRCITPKDGEPLCDNWQYAVNLDTPSGGMAGTILSGGETVGVYFGSSHNLTLSKSSVYTGDSLTVNTLKYNYENNSWIPFTGVNIGVTLPNKDDPWNPIIVSTYAVDGNGSVNLTINNANTYGVGIAEDYYFPSYTLTVSNKESSSGGTGESPKNTFSVNNAISFLLSQQESDGSFGQDLYTDWVAVAVSSTQSGVLKSNLIKYLKSNDLDSDVVTDYERRAMALMSLGINPYSGTSINYIEKIVDSFDGQQIGEKSLINDDIFGLIVLSKAGYEAGEDIIDKTIEYIISKQLPDGSWGSVDLTSASLQALDNFSSAPGVSDAMSKARNYLEGHKGIDGSFGNIYSTSWALQALSCNSCFSDSLNYLSKIQLEDGGMSEDSKENRIWATSYAIPASLGLSWNDILNSFNKKNIKSISSDSDDYSKEDTDKNEEKVNAPLNVLVPDSSMKEGEIIENYKVNNNKISLSAPKKDKQGKDNVAIRESAHVINNISENSNVITGITINQKIHSVFSDILGKISSFFTFLWRGWFF